MVIVVIVVVMVIIIQVIAPVVTTVAGHINSAAFLIISHNNPITTKPHLLNLLVRCNKLGSANTSYFSCCTVKLKAAIMGNIAVAIKQRV